MAEPVDLYADPDQLRLAQLVEWAHAEADALGALLPAAIDAQWSAPPRPRPSDEIARKASGEKSDPTVTVALDSARMQLRSQVLSSETELRKTIAALRGVRLGLERHLGKWEGSNGPSWKRAVRGRAD